MTETHRPVTSLSTEESWALLTGRPVGRLATCVAGKPDMFPVNFVVDGEDIVIRTERGNKLLELTINDQVAFEVDDWREGIGGWSVVCRGRAQEVESSEDLERAEGLPLQPWVRTIKTVFVRIHVDVITGRSFRFTEEETTRFEPED